MPTYAYKARSRRGELMNGVMDAESADRVAEQLFHSGITPVEISEREGANDPRQPTILSGLFKPGVSLDELIMLCRQLRTLLKAGVPILRGLGGLAETTRNTTLADTLQDVLRQLQAGRELNVSLAQHPQVFTPMFIALVRVGENTGQLDQAFAFLADYIEQEKQTRERIKSALRYPAIVISAIIIAVGIINVFVIPAFADAFARFDAELPLMTQMLIGTSGFVLKWWPWLLAGTVLGAAVAKVWLATDEGSYWKSKTLLRLPLIGHILTRATLGRFAQSLALTIRAGVPLVTGLTVVAGVVDNAYVSERVLSMRDGIEKGDSVSRTALATGLFTPLVLQMISVGEETGAIDELLLETSEHYQQEVEYELKQLSDAIEPIVIVIIGAMVTVLALGVFLPLWDLSSAVK